MFFFPLINSVMVPTELFYFQKLKSEAENKERRKEVEEQMMFWTKRDETQSKQYELLLEKLNEVAKEARESRALAEAERQRAGKLEALLKEKQNDRNREIQDSTDADEVLYKN